MEQFQQTGDFHGTLREHMLRHQMQMQQKQQAMQLQDRQQMIQAAAPGGGQPPRAGAKPGGPRPNGQGPAGQIGRDQLQNAAPRPRGM